MARFIKFLKLLLDGSTTPVFLMVVAHPTNRAKKMNEFVEEHSELIELYYVLGYATLWKG